MFWILLPITHIYINWSLKLSIFYHFWNTTHLFWLNPHQHLFRRRKTFSLRYGLFVTFWSYYLFKQLLRTLWCLKIRVFPLMLSKIFGIVFIIELIFLFSLADLRQIVLSQTSISYCLIFSIFKMCVFMYSLLIFGVFLCLLIKLNSRFGSIFYLCLLVLTVGKYYLLLLYHFEEC